MGLLRLLFAEPEKQQEVIINIFKVLLTLLFSQLLFNYPQIKNLTWLIENYGEVSIKSAFRFLLAIVLLWIFIWRIMFTMFFYLGSLQVKVRDKGKKIKGREIEKILCSFGVASKGNNGYYHPTRLTASAAKIVSEIKNESLGSTNTLFTEGLFIAIVSWFYFLFQSGCLCENMIILILSGIVLFFLILVWRFAEILFEGIYDNSFHIKDFLNSLVYRRLVNQVVQKTFKARFDSERSGYIVTKDRTKYEVLDFYAFNNKIGNLGLRNLLHDFERKNQKEKVIVVTNVELDEESAELVRHSKLTGLVMATNEEELVERLTALLLKVD